MKKYFVFLYCLVLATTANAQQTAYNTAMAFHQPAAPAYAAMKSALAPAATDSRRSYSGLVFNVRYSPLIAQ